MNIVHVRSLKVKVVIKCGYHVLYNPNVGIHMAPVISYTVGVMLFIEVRNVLNSCDRKHTEYDVTRIVCDVIQRIDVV